MLIVILIIATLLTVAWIMLLGRATRDDWIAAAYGRLFDNTAAIEGLRSADAAKRARLSGYSGIAAAGMALAFFGFAGMA